MSTDHARLADESRELRKQLKTFQTTFENTKFSIKTPIVIFDFLTAIVIEAESLAVFEAYAFLLMPKLLKSQAERHLRLTQVGARSGKVAYWPEIVTHFLCT